MLPDLARGIVAAQAVVTNTVLSGKEIANRVATVDRARSRDTGATAGRSRSPHHADDAKEVFRRAFWREPAAEDRILHAERREWVSGRDGVRRWQWFLAVEPSAALSAWLRESNPFNVAQVEHATFQRADSSPAWFPAAPRLARCQIQQTAHQGMTFIFDTAENVLYATDTGHGFATGRQQKQVAAPSTTVRDAEMLPPTWQPSR